MLVHLVIVFLSRVLMNDVRLEGDKSVGNRGTFKHFFESSTPTCREKENGFGGGWGFPYGMVWYGMVWYGFPYGIVAFICRGHKLQRLDFQFVSSCNPSKSELVG